MKIKKMKRLLKPAKVKCLELSTAHYTRQDDDVLEGISDDDEFTCLKTGAGYMMRVTDDGCIVLEERDASPALLDIYAAALSGGVWWLSFDCDAGEYDGLPTYDW